MRDKAFDRYLNILDLLNGYNPITIIGNFRNRDNRKQTQCE